MSESFHVLPMVFDSESQCEPSWALAMFLTVSQQTVSCLKKCRKNRSLQKFPFQVSLPILSMFSGSSVRLRSGRVEISDGRIGEPLS